MQKPTVYFRNLNHSKLHAVLNINELIIFHIGTGTAGRLVYSCFGRCMALQVSFNEQKFCKLSEL